MESQASYYVELARDCYEVKDYTKAIDYYESALEHQMTTELRNTVSLELGINYSNAERYEKASIILKPLLGKFDDRTSLFLLHSTLGFAYNELRDYTNALSQNKLALELSETDFQMADSYLNLALTHFFLENYPQAKLCFSNAQSKLHNFDKFQLFLLHYYSGMTYLHLGEYENAITFINKLPKVLSSEDHSAMYFYISAIYYRLTANFEEMVIFCDKALKYKRNQLYHKDLLEGYKEEYFLSKKQRKGHRNKFMTMCRKVFGKDDDSKLK